MSLGYRSYIGVGMVAAAMLIAAAGGCVTRPPPVAESVANSQPTKSVSHAAGDESVPDAAPSPPGKAEGPGTSAATTSTRPTSVQHRATLDKQLNDSLNAFDARLRQEQLRTAQDRDARQATVAVAATTPASTSGAAVGTEAAVKARTERPGDLKSEKSGGATANVAGNGAPATVVPDGNDDDIVARRLRKAADQETDPELKDKLWKEYVQYKKNTQVR